MKRTSCNFVSRTTLFSGANTRHLSRSFASTSAVARPTTLCSSSLWRPCVAATGGGLRFGGMTAAQRNNGLFSQRRGYSTGEIKTQMVPGMGDSITEGEVKEWVKKEGDYVNVDDIVCLVETDKVSVEIRASHAGTIKEVLHQEGDTVAVGAELFKIAVGEGEPQAAPKASEPAKEKPSSSPQKQQPQQQEPPKQQQAPPPAAKPAAPEPKQTTPPPPPSTGPTGGERRVKMSRLRSRVADRLKSSQNTYAMLTTFQECDMYNLMQMREEFKEEFQKKHGVKLGFMSAFVKAAVRALQDQPVVNAVIDGQDIVYRDFIDISVAVATPKGLVVPVLRGCDKMSFADVEKNIAHLGTKARNDQITIEDMAGGTFTISNGGVYGSLMGTPIINPPQSAILGMHAINNKPVAIGNEVKIRPIMYLALTYDHRLIDGKEAVTFLRTIKHCVEDPRRLLLDL
ncbi:2-oxoglutarate dehydrogenase complex component E2 [Balamuthia mandrillaris]